MSQRAQQRQVCGRSRELARENARLRVELHRKEQEIGELEAANAELRVERDAADVLLGAAMDAAGGLA